MYARYSWIAAISLFVWTGCGPEPEPEPEPEPVIEPVFGDVSGWSEERDCRFTHEHELRYIRVVADPGAREPYRALDPSTPYPVGATLVKLEYDDENCTQLTGYTAMQKQEPGFSATGNDWRWQRA